MIVHPVHIPRSSGRGANPAIRQKIARCNQLAEPIESYLSARIAERDEPVRQFFPYRVADVLCLEIGKVRSILFGVHLGASGLVASKCSEHPSR